MKSLLLVLVLASLSGCSWLHARFGHQKPPSQPTEFIVTGAPVNALIFIDGVQTGEAQEPGKRSQVVDVKPGTHIIEIKSGAVVVYREDSDVAAGEKRVITVLSGANRY